MTTTTAADGVITTTIFDAQGYPATVTVSGPHGPASTMQQTYNEYGQMTFIRYPMLNSKTMTYDTNNPALRSRGNVIAVKVDTGPRGGPGYTQTFKSRIRVAQPALGGVGGC